MWTGRRDTWACVLGTLLVMVSDFYSICAHGSLFNFVWLKSSEKASQDRWKHTSRPDSSETSKGAFSSVSCKLANSRALKMRPASAAQMFGLIALTQRRQARYSYWKAYWFCQACQIQSHEFTYTVARLLFTLCGWICCNERSIFGKQRWANRVTEEKMILSQTQHCSIFFGSVRCYI